MSRFLRAVILFFVLLSGGFFFSGLAQAQITGTCSYTVSPNPVKQGAESTVVTIGIDPNGPRRVCRNEFDRNCYEIRTCNEGTDMFGYWCHNNGNFVSENQSFSEVNGHPVIQSITANLQYARPFWIEYIDPDGNRNDDFCRGFKGTSAGPRVEVLGNKGGFCSAGWVTVKNAQDPASQRITENDRVRVEYNADKTFRFRGAFAAGYGKPDGNNFIDFVRMGEMLGRLFDSQERLDAVGSPNFEFGPLSPGEYEFVIMDNNLLGHETYCEERFTICDSRDERCTTNQTTDKGGEDQAREKIQDFTFCGQLPAGSEERLACERCNPDDSNQLYTALGCIRLDSEGLARDFIGLAFSIAGIVAFLSILAASFLFTTSQGDSGRVKEAKELMTAAISGLLFIIFSIIILDFIGVQLLRIPGLS